MQSTYVQQKPVEIKDLFLTTLSLHSIDQKIYSYKLFVSLIYQFCFPYLLSII